MFEKFSLKAQFKLLVLPVMVLTAILILFISYSEYESSQKLKMLDKDIKVVEDLRKLVTLMAKERELSLKLINSKSEVLAKRVSRDLKKQRSINNTRVKSLKNKLDSFSLNEIESRIFLKNVVENLSQFNTKHIQIRKRIDNKEISSDELIKSYSSFVSNLIDSISKSSLEVQDSSISKNIVIYSIFLKYLDNMSQRDIFLEDSVIDQKLSPHLLIELSKIEASREVINDIASGLVDRNLFAHYERLSKSEEVIEIEKLNSSLLENRVDILQQITVSEFLKLSRKYHKKLKELDDYISREILTDLSSKIDTHDRRESLLTIVFLSSILVILFSTYAVYNYLRETLFFGTIKIISKILRVVTDISLSKEFHGENEIRSLISIVSTFVKLIKESLSKIRTNFRDIVNLSNHLSESSETIVNHIQKQSRYLEDINLQMAIFLENIRNSEISFDNLKEIIEDSSAKINNLNLDVIYISYEVLSLKDLNRKVVDNKETLKQMIISNISLLENFREDERESRSKDILDSLNKMVTLIDEQNEIMMSKEEKLSNLSQTALAIKKDAEINNANLSDILGVITVLGYETKSITSEIHRTVEDNESFINVSKSMVSKSEFVSSDVKMLNKYIVNLDKEFNKFRF